MNDTQTCEWWLDDDEGFWGTSCGHMFRLDNGSPSQNRMAFCCYCGKPLTSTDSGEECSLPPV